MSRSHQATFGDDGSLRTTDYPDVAGIDDINREPTEVEIRWGITWDELERRHMESPFPRNDRERRCPECRKRVTKTPDGIEAGHAKGRKNERCSEYPGFYQQRDSLAWGGASQ